MADSISFNESSFAAFSCFLATVHVSRSSLVSTLTGGTDAGGL